MKVPHKHAAVIKAWADGKTIVFRYRDNMYQWTDWMLITKHPSWSDTFEYRVKPEPKPDVVKYLVFSRNQHICFYQDYSPSPTPHDLKLTFDGETGKLKSAEVL